jgi:hypothetical protein
VTTGDLTVPRRLAVLGAVALATMAAAGPVSAAQPRLRSCAPVVRRITHNGRRINFFGPLSATRNVLCSTARAMSSFLIMHESEGGFRFRGVRWTRRVSRPRGNNGPTVFTLSSSRPIRVIRITINVPVS